MKKLLLLSFLVLFSLFFKIPTAHAIDYSASATAKDLTITVRLSGPTSPQIVVQPVINESPITSVPKTPWFEAGAEKKTTDPSGTTELKIKAPKQNTLYHIRVLKVEIVGGKEVKQFITNDITVTTGSAGEIFSGSISVKKAEGNRYDLRGNINLSKHKETDSIPLSTISVKVNICKLNTCKDPSGAKEIILQYPPVQPLEKTDGLFVFTIDTSTLDPGTDYDLVVIFDSTTGAHLEKTSIFNTEKGIPLAGKSLDNYFDKNSYRLLAPIPGMVALLDPALCQERKMTDPGQICDINAFLNFILKLIIGLAAVVLVVRLIIEGYSYMITDTPFKKASAKGNFKEALIGLVIALSSYLILNTINPRLVNNDLKIGVAEFDIEEDSNEIITDDRFSQNNTIRTNRNCKGRIVDVKTGNGSFIDVCDEISKKIELMFSDAKRAGIVLSGGGYRTYQEQTVLYNQNCGGGRRKCSPPTARPGHSMHETGKAFDLKCDGALITFSTPYKGTRVVSTKKCFDWLTQNAHKYGLKNLQKENWHWSVNGK